MTIRKIMISLLAMLGLCTLALASSAYFAIDNLESHLLLSTRNTVPSMREIGDMRAEMAQARIGLAELASAETVEQTLDIDERLSRGLARADKLLKDYEPLVYDAEERGIYDKMNGAWATWTAEADPIRSLALSLDGGSAKIRLYGSFARTAARLDDTMLALVAYNNRLAQRNRDESARESTRARAWEISAALFAAICIAIAAFIVLRRVLAPMAAFTATLADMAQGRLSDAVGGIGRTDEFGDMARGLVALRSAIAQKAQDDAACNIATQQRVVDILGRGLSALREGDLTVSIDEEFPGECDVLRRNFNETASHLGHALAQVAAAAEAVGAGAEQISAATGDLSGRTEQQAASIEESAAALQNITQGTRQSAQNASETAATMEAAHGRAVEGAGIVNRAVEAMSEIESSASAISQIVDVIEGISFQTNLLALNAGVEAARAGEAGKGFAVVANEVRALAQRSTQAARDIKELITASTRQVGRGVSLVGDSGKAFEAILVQVSQVSATVRDMSDSIHGQSCNLAQVNAAVGDMDRGTQQNAAMVEESSAAARSLAAEADRMRELVEQFRFAGADAVSAAVAHIAPWRMHRQAGPVPAEGPVRAHQIGSRASPPRHRTPGLPATHGNAALVVDDEWAEF